MGSAEKQRKADDEGAAKGNEESERACLRVRIQKGGMYGWWEKVRSRPRWRRLGGGAGAEIVRALQHSQQKKRRAGGKGAISQQTGADVVAGDHARRRSG